MYFRLTLTARSVGYISTTQALEFVQDQKIAHYMHLPPRIVFFAQLAGASIGSLTQLLVQDWLFKHVNGICTTSSPTWSVRALPQDPLPSTKKDLADTCQFDRWCPSSRTFFSSSVLYGLLGPQRLFSRGSLYSPLLWFFPLGAVLPIVTWLFARKWPLAGWKYVCWPVVFGCISLLPPYSPINFIRWGVLLLMIRGCADRVR